MNAAVASWARPALWGRTGRVRREVETRFRGRTNAPMANKVWFITGASRGFGRHWTQAALRRGDLVAATARDLSALHELVETYGDSVLPLGLDVTQRAAAREAVARAHAAFGRLDV